MSNKKQDNHRTLEERKAEIIPIIHKLSELTLTTQYDEIKELYRLFKIYIEQGERIEIKIIFPAIQRKIVGILAINKREKVWVKLEQLR
jgi:glutathione peroxidase-family protein